MEEIKEDKEKNFIRRQKERLFAIVDHVDKIDLTTHLHLRSSAQEDQEVQEVNEHTQMTNKVKLYRKRLNRWKNIGVWLVFISDGLTLLSAAVIRYYILVKDMDQTDDFLDKWVILGLFFGGINIVCQVCACLIMASATMTMQKLSQKNNFDSNQFSDIRMNLIVSILICVGYTVMYITEFVLTVLILKDKLTLTSEVFFVTCGRIFLIITIFFAYLILMKVFLTYQKQINKASAKLAKQQQKAKKKAEEAKAAQEEEQ